jgi:hypothetical protein
MAADNETEPLPVGTRVKIRHANFARAKIVEYRGRLGPGGARVYRVRYRGKPRPAYVEVREDQLEVVPADE